MDAKEVELLQDGYRFALSLTNNSAEAEDLVQDCWLKLYERKGKIESRTLLFTVIRNRFIDSWRRKKSVQMQSLDTASEQVGNSTDPDDKLLLEKVYEALEELPPKEREALYLQCMEEYTASEISELTGQPRGTVLSLIFRARNKLTELLGLSQEKGKILNYKGRV